MTRAEEAESSHILQILQQTKGVIGGRIGAAARLGLPRTTLIANMKRPGIKLGQSSVLPVRRSPTQKRQSPDRNGEWNF